MSSSKAAQDKAGKTSQSKTAQKQWELENNIVETDQYYMYDVNKQQEIIKAAPWKNEYVNKLYLFKFVQPTLL
jgi:hypothetical protein